MVNSIPSKSYKTVLDAFNGYHQVALDEESRQLTTFITEYGRYQYLYGRHKVTVPLVMPTQRGMTA